MHRRANKEESQWKLYWKFSLNTQKKIWCPVSCGKTSARFRANQITKALSALNPEAEEQIETLEMELNNIHAYREQALLLSGISIGLKLGRL